MVQQEAALLSYLDSDQIVKIEELYQSGQSMVIVMEFMDKGSLTCTFSNPQRSNLIREHHQDLSENACRYILYSVLKGLQKMHAKDVLHRDIKPENVLFSIDGNVKLCDLGIAMFLSDE